MKIVFRFLSRIIGLKHIKFLNSGIYLFDFSMFLLPIELYHKLINNLIKINDFKTIETLFRNIGYTQGIFAVNFFKKKYRVSATKEDYSFYFEQVQSIGLGEVFLKKLNVEKKEIILEVLPSLCFKNNLRDFYLEGLMIGVAKITFGEDMGLSFKKVENKFLYTIKPTKTPQFRILNKNYTLNNLLTPVNKKSFKNEFFLKLNKLNKKIFYFTPKGTFFNEKKYFFTLNSVFVLMYYESIKLNPKNKKVFFNLGGDFAGFVFNNFSSILSKTKAINYLFILSLFGFGEIFCSKINKNSAKLKFTLSSQDLITKKLYPAEFNIENNDFKIGYLFNIHKKIFESNIEYNIYKKQNKLIILDLLKK